MQGNKNMTHEGEPRASEVTPKDVIDYFFSRQNDDFSKKKRPIRNRPIYTYMQDSIGSIDMHIQH